jgi:hypothetical protein
MFWSNVLNTRGPSLLLTCTAFFKTCVACFSLRRGELQLSKLRKTPKALSCKEQPQTPKVDDNDHQHGDKNTNIRKNNTTGNA